MLSARDLATSYDRYVSARWRGDASADDFAVWLEAHWTCDAPSEPDDPPCAVSVLAGGRAGIRWYEREGIVLGYAPGPLRGCYWVPTGAAMPRVRGTREGRAVAPMSAVVSESSLRELPHSSQVEGGAG